MKKFLISILALLVFPLISFAEEGILIERDGVIIFSEGSDLFYEKDDGVQLVSPYYYDGFIFLSEEGRFVIYQDESSLSVYDSLTTKEYLLEVIDISEDEIFIDIQSHENRIFANISFGVLPVGKLCIYDLDLAFDEIQSGSITEGYSVKSGISCIDEENLINPERETGATWITTGEVHWSQDGDLIFEIVVYLDDAKIGTKTSIWKLPKDSSEAAQVSGNNPFISPFSDLDLNDPDYLEVLRAVQAGWLEGYPDGTVKLDNPLNRAELSKIATQALIIPEEIAEPGESVCPDVPEGEWYTNTFKTAKVRGAIQGYPEKGVPESQWLCKPGQTINKVESLKIMMELAGWNWQAFGFSETYMDQYNDTLDQVQWYWLYTGFSKHFGLIRSDDGNLDPGSDMTRREMIYLTNHILDIFGTWKDGI